tara:strand:+ start:21 stop:608 length:588 start_codon:yes stop_codon:yes gene_type:complete
MAGKYDDMSFKKAFVAARKAQGSGKVFTWKGKRYTTNTKEDEAKKKTTKSKSGAPKKSLRPKKRPGSGEPPVAKPGELAIKKVTTTFIGKGGNTRPLKIPAAVKNKVKKVDSDIKKISIGEREAASKRLATIKKRMADMQAKRVDANPGSKVDELLAALSKLGLYVKKIKDAGLGAGGGISKVSKDNRKKGRGGM